MDHRSGCQTGDIFKVGAAHNTRHTVNGVLTVSDEAEPVPCIARSDSCATEREADMAKLIQMVAIDSRRQSGGRERPTP